MTVVLSRPARRAAGTAAAALALVVPTAARAQSLAAGPTGPAAATAVVRVRPVATYRLAVGRDAALPAQVTVADSAGALVASYRLPGERSPRPLAVTVLDTDLVLQGESPSGLLTLVLDRQNGRAAAEPVTGRWALGEQSGALRGRQLP